MKKKLRQITVVGQPFYWKADWYYEQDCRIIRLRIWGNDKSGPQLYVNLLSRWLEYPTYESYPTPKDVATVIQYALAHGWQSNTRSQPYWLTEQADLYLENLLITDIGHLPVTTPPVSRQRLHPLYDKTWGQQHIETYSG